MPFYPPYVLFSKGDLLYGLSDQRKALKRALKLRSILKNKKEPWTIDDYRLSPEGRGMEEFLSPAFSQAFLEAMSRGYEDDRRKFGEMMKLYETEWASNALNRRKSKFGLDWITRHTSNHIHFCLDGLDMQAVVNKSYQGETSDQPVGSAPAHLDWKEKERSITGSELRWVYRNKADLRVRNGIQFWKNHLPCPPPWDTRNPENAMKELWDTYQPKEMW